MNGELVGDWTRSAQGRHAFSYCESWLESRHSRPLSLCMPLRNPALPYRDELVENFFDNLLPDSAAIRDRVQARFGATSSAAFDLLSEIGRDCVGAVQILPAGAEPPDIRQVDASPIDSSGVAAVLRDARSPRVLGQVGDDAFRISLAGAQEKTALLRHAGAWHIPHGATPTTHILKLPLGLVGNMQADLSGSVENEWLCSTIARAYGLSAAHCDIAIFEDQKVLVVKRFDRKLANAGYWLRLPQEDMCQATGTPPALKYEADGGPGVATIMDLLSGSQDQARDKEQFFLSQVLFWLLAATDGHAKNFSVSIKPSGNFALTPLYDVLSAHPILGHGANQLAPEKVKLSMAIRGENAHYHWTEIQGRHWLAMAGQHGIQRAEELLADMAAKTPAVIETIHKNLPPDFPEEVSNPILAGLEHAAVRLERTLRP